LAKVDNKNQKVTSPAANFKGKIGCRILRRIIDTFS